MIKSELNTKEIINYLNENEGYLYRNHYQYFLLGSNQKRVARLSHIIFHHVLKKGNFKLLYDGFSSKYKFFKKQ